MYWSTRFASAYVHACVREIIARSNLKGRQVPFAHTWSFVLSNRSQKSAEIATHTPKHTCVGAARNREASAWGVS